MKLLVLWHYCQAHPLFAASLLFTLGSGFWLVTIIVPGSSSLASTQLILGASTLIIIICAVAKEDKLLSAAVARTMLAAGSLLFIVGALLNGDGTWFKGALFSVTAVGSICGVMLYARSQEQQEEPTVDHQEERQVEHQLTK